MKTILVVDDKSSMRKLLEDFLTGQGFRVHAAADGQQALAVLQRIQPDLVLLDIMMPQMDGYEFLRRHRQEKNTPVIILTALEDEQDTVLGLDLGADDYITKPFRMQELNSRIRAVLRRTEHPETAGRTLHVGDLSLDDTTHMVTVRGQRAHLTPREFELLRLLLSRPGWVFTREQIVDTLALRGFDGLPNTLNVHIRNLRTKIEVDPDHPEYIETVFGVGYRLHAPEP